MGKGVSLSLLPTLVQTKPRQTRALANLSKSLLRSAPPFVSDGSKLSSLTPCDTDALDRLSSVSLRIASPDSDHTVPGLEILTTAPPFHV